MTELAKLKWKFKYAVIERGWWFWKVPAHAVFELADGTLFTVVGPEEAWTAVDDLAREYLDLGDSTADALTIQMGNERATAALAQKVLKENQILRQRIDAAPEADQIVPIMAADLEQSLNMMMRFAQSLGVQAKGPLYDAMEKLLTKYKMKYIEPNRNQVVNEAFERDVLGADTITASLDAKTGRMNYMPAPGATIEGGSNGLDVGDDYVLLPPSTRGYLLEDNDDDGDPS